MEKEDIEIFYKCVHKKFGEKFTLEEAERNLVAIREILANANPYKNQKKDEYV